MRWVSLLGLFILLTACGRSELSDSDVALPEAPSEETAVSPTAQIIEPELAVTNTAVPPPTTLPITTDPPIYAVAFVESTDVLNIRSGPGVVNNIVGALPPTASDVQMTGDGQIVSGSTWVPIQQGSLTGWVNSRFLTQVVADELFCSDAAVGQLLDQLETAVANQDNTLFAQLINPERGLRVRLRWSESEIRLNNNALFSDPTSHNWGVAAGSGEQIIGSPAQILLPLLQADFLTATESACNQLLVGPTAGLTPTPNMYKPINYYSFYRPGGEEFAGLNWGSWAIGVELWRGQYCISTLVHYQWEP